MMRSQSCLKLVQTVTPAARSIRCLSTTPSTRLQYPTARAGPASQKPQTPEEPTEDKAGIVVAEQKSEGENAVGTHHPHHSPDYRARVDHGTSLYSPVPLRVQDGSEPGETLPAAVLSGAPVDLQARVVRIYKPIRPATQSGTWGSSAWRMDWDPLPRGHRWENPLMGWASSADSMQGTNIKFKSKEAAVAFAEKQGYEYYVQEPQERRFVPKAYANNFLHEPGPLKHIKTK